MTSKMLAVLFILTAMIGHLHADTYTGCEKERFALTCPDKMAPEIQSANWGRQEGATCPPASADMDCSVDVTEEVRERCNEKKCALSPNKRSLGDPCEGDGKLIISIEYNCRPEPTTTTTSATTTTTTQGPTEGQVRLVDGDSSDEGFAQIYKTGQWGNICDIEFVNHGWPRVFCIDLGYASALNSIYATERDASYVGSYPITFESPACDPNTAASMAVCGVDDEPACGHNKDVYVKCGTQNPGVENQVRLVDGETEDEGLVQIFKDGQWGNICDIEFGPEGWPSVLCIELGYPGALESVYAAERDASYVGSYPINFESPACNPSNAASMAACGVDDEPACGHDKDVYVKCG